MSTLSSANTLMKAEGRASRTGWSVFTALTWPFSSADSAMQTKFRAADKRFLHSSHFKGLLEYELSDDDGGKS